MQLDIVEKTDDSSDRSDMDVSSKQYITTLLVKFCGSLVSDP